MGVYFWLEKSPSPLTIPPNIIDYTHAYLSIPPSITDYIHAYLSMGTIVADELVER